MGVKYVQSSVIMMIIIIIRSIQIVTSWFVPIAAVLLLRLGIKVGTKKQLKHFLWSIHPYAGHPPKGFLYLCLFLFLFLLLYSLFVAMILRMAITTYSAHKTT